MEWLGGLVSRAPLLLGLAGGAAVIGGGVYAAQHIHADSSALASEVMGVIAKERAHRARCALAGVRACGRRFPCAERQVPALPRRRLRRLCPKRLPALPPAPQPLKAHGHRRGAGRCRGGHSPR